MAIEGEGAMIELESNLVLLCIEAATQSRDAVETWRRQRRTIERLPSQLAEALLCRLLHRRLLYPSLLEVFKYSIEEIDLRDESSVDAEWLAYIGSFRYLHSLNVADCHKINNSALWPLAGMTSLKVVDLSRCSKVTDAGIKHLLSIQTLKKLCISETGVTANGVTLLSSLTNLSMLDLGGLRINDQALGSLQVLRKLRYLDLWGSEISNKGAAILQKFSKLTFLNLALTKVTKVPNLPSLTFLNMSNCTIHSLFEGLGNKACLSKFIMAGASFIDISQAFLHVNTNFLYFLDVSNSSINRLGFLPNMNAMAHLDISGTSVEDDSVEMIAFIGANLRFLNLNNTRVSSVGVGILAGHVPNLETLLLSSTRIDDLAMSYIGMMPSLKVINLSSTNVRGLIQQIGDRKDLIPSLTALQNLSYLERLDMEETKVSDAALEPLPNFQALSYLSLRNGFLTDESLYRLSSIRKLIVLSIQDAVLTNGGLDSLNPPPTLEVLDLRGCWLITEDILSSFCHKHPQIEVKHELVSSLKSDQDGSKYSSPTRVTSANSQRKQNQSKHFIVDERLKYDREELLALQFSSSVPLIRPWGRGDLLIPK
ncbi:hypothetical protein LguiA_034403 [Lonicera macranthoides]